MQPRIPKRRHATLNFLFHITLTDKLLEPAAIEQNASLPTSLINMHTCISHEENQHCFPFLKRGNPGYNRESMNFPLED